MHEVKNAINFSDKYWNNFNRILFNSNFTIVIKTSATEFRFDSHGMEKSEIVLLHAVIQWDKEKLMCQKKEKGNHIRWKSINSEYNVNYVSVNGIQRNCVNGCFFLLFVT